jgi:hypothetical protein
LPEFLGKLHRGVRYGHARSVAARFAIVNGALSIAGNGEVTRSAIPFVLPTFASCVDTRASKRNHASSTRASSERKPHDSRESES